MVTLAYLWRAIYIIHSPEHPFTKLCQPRPNNTETCRGEFFFFILGQTANCRSHSLTFDTCLDQMYPYTKVDNPRSYNTRYIS